MTPLIAVTDHAADETRPGPKRGSVDVRDGALVFVCVHDVPRGELVVVTLWEEDEGAAVPRRFTDAVPEPRSGEARLHGPRDSG